MKKKIYFTIVCISILCIAQAQVKKGDVLLGGGLSVSSDKNQQGTSTSSFGIYPSIGIAVKDNLVVGANLQYQHYKYDYLQTKSDAYGLTAFVRKYKPLGSGFALFLEGDLGFGYQKQTTLQNSNTVSSKDQIYKVMAGFTPGIAYAVSKRVQLEMSFMNMGYASYSHEKSTSELIGTGVTGSGHSDSFTLSTNLSQVLNNFLFGVRFII